VTRILLVSTYELGHQPIHLAEPAAALIARGIEVDCIDTSVEAFDLGRLDNVDALALSVPMHTAMRLGLEVAEAARAARPELPVAFYGLYGNVAEDRTVGALSARAIAGDYLDPLLAWADELGGSRPPAAGSILHLRRGRPPVPRRDLLPPLERYARAVIDGEQRLAGAIETTRGCRHACRHCPVPAVYGGRLRTLSLDGVLADAAALVELGARHLTLADADFLNAPIWARSVLEALHQTWPELTFDVTVKVEHLLAHQEMLEVLAEMGCRFVTSAVESVERDVLQALQKGHSPEEATAALEVVRAHGMELRPSFVPFTPWSTRPGIVALLRWLADLDLLGSVDPVQLAIRLLIPDRSLLLSQPGTEAWLEEYDPDELGWRWHPLDRSLDELWRDLAEIAEAGLSTEGLSTETVIAEMAEVAGAGHLDVRRDPRVEPPGRRPRLSETWFCCAEPTSAQRQGLVRGKEAASAGCAPSCGSA
jgi:hypothetical protein